MGMVSNRTSVVLLVLVLFALLLGVLGGCSDKVTNGERFGATPETELTWGPADSDTITFRVHFFWAGTDKDGEVVRYRFAADADTVEPPSSWTSTTANDSILAFPVDPVTAIRTHAFLIASEDNDGRIDPTPARRFFTTRTVPPTSCIKGGPSAYSRLVRLTFTFEWTSHDPDGGVIGQGGEVDSFEFLLLRVGSLAGSGTLEDVPLPPFDENVYVTLINSAVGSRLPEPYDDWTWTGVRGSSHQFWNISPGDYVFAVRAVDQAGAQETVLEFGCNIRMFTIPHPAVFQAPPRLSICASPLIECLSVHGESIDGNPLEVFEGEAVSFSWHAVPGFDGASITGYTYAFDDTISLPTLDAARTGVILTPDQLTTGTHYLFVMAFDDYGYASRALVPIQVIHPAFLDPGNGRSILYVDDSTAPGVSFPGQDETTSFGNFPNDVVETAWWMLGLLNQLGVPVTEWDATLAGSFDLQARKPPPLRTLANYSTVIWNVDFNNSFTNPTALWRTLVGDRQAVLRSYVRGGGTLIVTGFDVSSSTVNPTTIFDALTTTLCGAFPPGTPQYRFTYVPRTMMGIDRAVLSKSPRRRDGARDFVAAYPTPSGSSAGFDSAVVDSGPLGSGAKWITNLSSTPPDENLSPGIMRVDGWVMAQNFNCATAPGSYRVEDPGQAIGEPILRYHGVNLGVNQDLGPSPREGLVAGIRVQAHDLGESMGPGSPYGSGNLILTPGNARGAYGRAVFLSFPLYWLKDDDAIQVMQAAFQYVNASPTLP
jgi:hypothetical protein